MEHRLLDGLNGTRSAAWNVDCMAAKTLLNAKAMPMIFVYQYAHNRRYGSSAIRVTCERQPVLVVGLVGATA